MSERMAIIHYQKINIQIKNSVLKESNFPIKNTSSNAF